LLAGGAVRKTIEQLQYWSGRNPSLTRLTQVGSDAAERILVRLGSQTFGYRKVVNVPHHRQQIGLRLKERRLIAAPKKLAPTPGAPLHALGKMAGQIAHKIADTSAVHPQHHVNGIRHPAIRQQLRIGTLQCIGHQLLQNAVVSIR